MQYVKTAENLKMWIEKHSWEICKCGLRYPSELTRSDLDGVSHVRARNEFVCANCRKGIARFLVPVREIVPIPLWSIWDQYSQLRDAAQLLRCVTISHLGNVGPGAHGHPGHQGIFRLEYVPESVESRIANSTIAEELKEKLLSAYAHLRTDANCDYARFLKQQQTFITGGEAEVLNMHQRGIESAIWPILYCTQQLCESWSDEGHRDGHRRRESFNVKLVAAVSHYREEPNLVLFQWQRWMDSNLDSAETIGKKHGFAPAVALAHYPWSNTYMMGQRAILSDIVDQFGQPNLFLTLTVNDVWKDGFPLHRMFRETGSSCKSSVLMTLHASNVLAQIMKGYICGVNQTSGSCRYLLFNPMTGKNSCKALHFRFEFMKRGTVHLHALIWATDYAQTLLWPRIFRFGRPFGTSLKNFGECLKYHSMRTNFIDTVLWVLHSEMDLRIGDSNPALVKYMTKSGLEYNGNKRELLSELEIKIPAATMMMFGTPLSFFSGVSQVIYAKTGADLDSDWYRGYLKRHKKEEMLSLKEWLRVTTFDSKCGSFRKRKTDQMSVNLGWVYSPPDKDNFWGIHRTRKLCMHTPQGVDKHAVPAHLPIRGFLVLFEINKIALGYLTERKEVLNLSMTEVLIEQFGYNGNDTSRMIQAKFKISHTRNETCQPDVAVLRSSRKNQLFEYFEVSNDKIYPQVVPSAKSFNQ